jgi:hypothetical protein
MVLWDVMPHNLGGTCCFHLQGRTLKIEVEHASEKLVKFYQSARHQPQKTVIFVVTTVRN